MRVWVAVMAVLALFMAGCGSNSSPSGTTEPSGTSASPSGSPPTSHPSASPSPTGGDSPPSATLTVTPTGGLSPVHVNFTATGQDSDGDNLTYSLAFGDGTAPAAGNVLPAHVAHTYTNPGNFTAAITIRDAHFQANATVVLHVGVGPNGAGLTFAKAVQTYCQQCANGATPSTPGACVGWEQGSEGMDCAWVAIPAGLVGHKFNALADSGGDLDLSFLSSCTASPTATTIQDFLASGPGEKGTVPAGAGCVLMWNSPSVPPAAGPGAATLSIVIS
ncbi:MAG: PKD domain-containing protein [Thermoplasmatota archaeon]